MVSLIIAFLVGGVIGFIAGVKNANSSKVAIAKQIIDKANK
jgi:hypothetical protein